MLVSNAVLCDYATVREGLLHVLGGGITRLWRTSVPAPLGLSVALTIEMEQEVAHMPHDVGVVVRDPDAVQVGEVRGVVQFQANGPNRMEPGELHLIPMQVPLHVMQVERFGRYTIEVWVGEQLARALPVWILHPEELEMPPLGD